MDLSQTFVESSVPPEYPRGLQMWCGRHSLYGHISLSDPSSWGWDPAPPESSAFLDSQRVRRAQSWEGPQAYGAQSPLAVIPL